MNKGELIEAVAKATKLSKKDSTNAVNSTLEIIKKNAKKGVLLVGFGSFSVTRRKARDGRNPQTGDKIRIKARNVVRFKPGKAFKV
jgi:DNA-binding protein HU-beta